MDFRCLIFDESISEVRNSIVHEHNKRSNRLFKNVPYWTVKTNKLRAGISVNHSRCDFPEAPDNQEKNSLLICGLFLNYKYMIHNDTSLKTQKP